MSSGPSKKSDYLTEAPRQRRGPNYKNLWPLALGVVSTFKPCAGWVLGNDEIYADELPMLLISSYFLLVLKLGGIVQEQWSLRSNAIPGSRAVNFLSLCSSSLSWNSDCFQVRLAPLLVQGPCSHQPNPCRHGSCTYIVITFV